MVILPIRFYMLIQILARQSKGTAVTQHHKSKNDGRGKRRKVAAIMAGGLVVGIGTMATLASWNDTEYAAGSFTAGSFDMVGSLDGTAYTQHTTSGTAATLAFSSPVGALSPSDVVGSPFALRLAKVSSNGATVTVTPGGNFTNGAGLTYGMYTTATFGCTAATTPLVTIVPAGTALNATTGAVTFNLAKPADASTEGAAVNLCVKVTAGATGLVQGQTSTTAWLFTATSN
jgi:predicted ribosomally synthesized peptide with SipW-like signal peptide